MSVFPALHRPDIKLVFGQYMCHTFAVCMAAGEKAFVSILSVLSRELGVEVAECIVHRHAREWMRAHGPVHTAPLLNR
jgi:hypothetical protein